MGLATVIMIVTYDGKIFIVQVTDLFCSQGVSVRILPFG
jgi:hypothetical protein